MITVNLEGKVAAVTGDSSGIGFAAASALAEAGAHVYVMSRRPEELISAVAKIGPNATGVQGDVSSQPDLDRLYAQIKTEKGKLDVLMANAGIAKYAPIGSITEELYDTLFDTNVKGLVFTVQKALPLMSEGGSIILTASVVGSKGLPSNSIYSATKAAVRSFARTWTTDLKDRGIRVNAISPGTIDTPGLERLFAAGGAGEQRRKSVATTIPMGRLGKPEEVAKAVVFLASDNSSFITGTEVFVDGGFAQV